MSSATGTMCQLGLVAYTKLSKGDPAMHVVLDFNPVLRSRYSGFWGYGVGLLGGLLEQPEVACATLLCSRSSQPAGGEIPCWGHPKTRVVATAVRMRRWERWWRLVRWPSLQRWCGDFDVYHGLHHLMPPTAGRPRVLTVHDLRRYRFPQLYPRAKLGPFERAVAAAERILAISHSTKADLMEFLGVEPEHIDVVHSATPEGFAPASSGQRARTLEGLSARFGRAITGYAVCVSSRDRRKNLQSAIRAFAQARAELSKGSCLVVVGERPEGVDLEEILAANAAAGDVLFTGTLGQDDYAAVLAGGDVFLCLSLYEGFGLPVLEAMACGVPAIASNTSSLPEVTGRAGILVGPTDTDEIAHAVVSLSADPARRQELVQAGLHRAGQFTWARTAAQTMACYKRAL